MGEAMICLKRFELDAHQNRFIAIPSKACTPEPLDGARLTPGRCLPWDRAFALAQGDATLDPENPAWVKKSHFMCLARNAKIAALNSRFDDAARRLIVTTPQGRQA